MYFFIQAVLVRYESDFEVLSQKKDVLNELLLTTQNELKNLREEKDKIDIQEEVTNNDKKMDTTEEVFDSSCFMAEPSMSASMMDMDQTADSDDKFSSWNQLNDESTPAVKVPDAAALRMQKVDDSNKRKQELEEMSDKLVELQKEVSAKTTALEESLRSLETAQLTIENLERRDE